MQPTISQQTLDLGEWQLLAPPSINENDTVEVGVLEIHPSLPRVVYTTRRHTDQSHDIGNTLIVVQHLNDSSVMCCFSLQELADRIEAFRCSQHTSATAASMTTHHHHHHNFSLESLSVSRLTTTQITAQSLGAIQKISFMDREAVRSTVAPGFVKDDPSKEGAHKLIINFRGCIVVVSVFKQTEAYARSIIVQGCIGLDDLEGDNSTKKQKRRPSTCAIPISEHIVAYGCLDGGLRCYDLLSRKQVDTFSGDVLYFDIPPPIATFDGLVAAVSGRGLPVKHPPSLSPTSIASLSPSSSWDEVDKINSQFDVKFDNRRNLMLWTFSPDCIGSSLHYNASREGRLNTNGSLVIWDLSSLPEKEWPPPMADPVKVAELPRTDRGRFSSNLVLPFIYTGSDSVLSTIYLTSFGEIMASSLDLEYEAGLSIQRYRLADLGSLHDGYECYAIASSTGYPTVIAFGTKSGVLLSKVTEMNDTGNNLLTSIDEVESVVFTVGDETYYQHPSNGARYTSDMTAPFDVDEWSLSMQQTPHWPIRQRELSQLHQLKTKIAELEQRNNELENEFKGNHQSPSESSCQASDKEMKSRVALLLEQQQRYCDSAKRQLELAFTEMEQLQNHLVAKDDSCMSMSGEIGALRNELSCLREILKQERDVGNTPPYKQLVAENDNLRQQLDELNLSNKDSKMNEKSSLSALVSDMLEEEQCKEDFSTEALRSAKENEESLRSYISLLEDDKTLMDNELDTKNKQLEEYRKSNEQLKADMKEQKLAIDSLVELLEVQKEEHTGELASQNNQIAELKSQLIELRQHLRKERDIAEHSELKLVSAETTISKLHAENIRLEEEALEKNALFIAMKVELQNALNELSDYNHGDHKSY
eukprot:scaffold949_cov186-Alexandrium_tamarense.AAC.8